jgi:hypothetical protein
VNFAGVTRSNQKSVWRCQCVCGKETFVVTCSLTRGTTISCGCYNKEVVFQRCATHQESLNKRPSPELRAFQTAKGRCNNPTDHAFSNYGGRGIEFRFNSFEEFLNELGRKPTPKHSIDRIDVNGHYEPGNVRWADDATQARNKRNVRTLTVDGITKLRCEWAEEYGIESDLIYERIRRGKWCIRCAVTLPTGSVCPHKLYRDPWEARRAKAKERLATNSAQE